MRFPRLTMLLLAALAVPSLASGEDWPQFRGPGGQGISTVDTLPIEWGPEKNVAWKVELPGSGWSSPITHAGRIYLTAAVPAGEQDSSDYSLRVLCLAGDTGKTEWNEEVFYQDGAKAARIHAKNGHASATPIIEAGKLYVHFGHMGTACLNLAGEVLWRQRIEYTPVHGNGGSPVLVDGRLVFSVDGARQQFVVALDQQTGEVAWKTDRATPSQKKFSFSTPLVIEIDGKRQIVSPGTDGVRAYAPADGQELWRCDYEGYSVIPRPVFGNGMLYLSTGYNTASMLAIRAGGSGDITESHLEWQLSTGAPHTPSPLLLGSELYLVSDRGIASCVDAKTGEVHWKERIAGGFSASPMFAGGRIYFQNETGTGYVVKASKTFELLATNELDERSLASYAVIDDTLLIRTQPHLYRLKPLAK